MLGWVSLESTILAISVEVITHDGQKSDDENSTIMNFEQSISPQSPQIWESYLFGGNMLTSSWADCTLTTVKFVTGGI